MRSSFFIASRFIKAHKWTALLGVLVISLFAAAFQASLTYNGCYAKTVENNTLKTYGEEAGIIYNADIAQTEKFLSETSEEMTGFCGYDAVYSETLDNKYYIGYMPKSVLDSKHRTLTEGRLPEREGEAAVEESIYSALGLTADIGDSFTVTVEQDGKPTEKTFTLCGKVESYLMNWQRTDVSKKSFTYPPPVILTVKDNSQAPDYIDVMCSHTPQNGRYFGGEFSDTLVILDSSGVKAQMDSIKVITVPLAAFIVIIMILGIYGVLQYIMNDYDKYVRLLGRIGMPLKKCIPIYLIVALAMMISASLIGSALGYFISLVFCRVISSIMLEQEIIFVYDTDCALIGCAVCSAVILLAFAASMIKYFVKAKKAAKGKNVKFKKRYVRPFGEDGSIIKLWKKAQARLNFSQKLLSGLLMFLCVIVACVGLLGSQMTLINTFQPVALDEQDIREDLIFYIPGGGAGPLTYNINQPEGSGVSAENLKELTDAGLKVARASMSVNIGAYVFYDTSDYDPALERYMEQASCLNEKETPTLEYALKAAGGTKNDYLMQNFDICIRKYDGLASDFDVEGIDKNEFESGKAIVAPEEYFNVGDKLTILTVSSVDPEKPADDPEKFLFHKDEYTVGAVTDCNYFVLCVDYLSNIHKAAKYDEVSLTVPDTDDKELVKTAVEKAEAVTAKSQYTSLDNRIRQREEYKQAFLSGLISFGLVVFVFELMTAAAVIISAKLKTKGDMRSLYLLNELGAAPALLVKLSALSNMKVILFSGGIAALLSAALAIERTVTYYFLPILGLAIGTVALCIFLTIFTAALCYIVSKREVVKAIKIN